jgi:hypothetical protein
MSNMAVGLNQIRLAYDRGLWSSCCVCGNEISVSVRSGVFRELVIEP